MLLAILACGCGQGTTVSNQSSNADPSSESSLTIRASDSPAAGDSREPELNATPDGRIILSWVEKVDARRYALRTSTRDGNGWSPAQTVAEGENWFVNWADFPSVVALDDGSLAAHWLVKNGSGTYAYDVNIARSKDGGKSWSKAIVPHLDNTQTEHGFVSLIPLAECSSGRCMARRPKYEGHEAWRGERCAVVSEHDVEVCGNRRGRETLGGVAT